jgi:hypothetical protein
MAMDLEALPVHSGALQGKGCMEPEAQARDRGAGDLVVQGGGGVEEPPDRLHTEDSGETRGSLSPQEREGVPVARENVRREEAAAPGAEAHRSRGKASDIFAVQEGTLPLRVREAVGGWVRALGQEADFPARGFLGPFALAAEVESRNHVLTQWGHESSPFVR